MMSNVVNYIDRNVASAWGVVSLTKMIRWVYFRSVWLCLLWFLLGCDVEKMALVCSSCKRFLPSEQ
uniref:Uncharacterized protein n=1 Tax=Fagus sylvatica TaxID=28930 RepID=A0A2N9EEG6_FAGSY